MDIFFIFLGSISWCLGCNFTFEEEESSVNDKGIRFNDIINVDGPRNKYHYSIVPESSVVSINQEGIIRFKRGTDREWLCKLTDLSASCHCKEAVCKIPFGISIQENSIVKSNPPKRKQIEICVRDKNDNCPKLQNPIHLTMIESAKIGFKLPLQEAVDNDSPLHSKSVYDLKCNADSKKFKLTMIDNKFPQLELISSLDHETTTSHTCKLEACEPKCCDTAVVTVTVIDDNDHPPIWTVLSWQVTIPENTPSNTQIMQLSATDSDSTYNVLRYSIEGPGQDLFLIEGPGIIRLLGVLDYEKLEEKTIFLTVKVTDNGLSQSTIKSATGTVTISVSDVNDNRPFIYIKNNIFSIDENVPRMYLGDMTVTDADSGINGDVSCLVAYPEDKISLSESKMSSNTIYDIFTSSSFDHEVSSRVSVKIVCSDNGQPKLSSSVELFLRIKDVDDNNVKFIKKFFATGVDEGKEIGTFLAKIEAVDKDSTSSLEYYLTDKKDLAFVELDRQTGVVRSNQVFDRETKDEYKINVTVREKFSPNKTDSAILLIKILDINDNDPKFDRLYSFSVSERKEINFQIGKVNAEDPDLRNNGTVVYTQQRLDEYQFPFFVDQLGKIRLFQRLDYEIQPLHHLIIVATDRGHPVSRSSTTTVIVSVIDENDNPPKFKSRYFEIDIGCHTRVISRDLIPVTDNDTDTKNRQMQFNLQMVTPSYLMKLFRIDNQTGEITMDIDQQKTLTCEKLPKLIELKIRVFDPTFTEFKDHCVLKLKLSQFYIKTPSNDHQIQDTKGKFKEKSINEKEPPNVPNNQFDSSIFLVVILIVFSVILLLLLTCVAVFTKRCKEDEQEFSQKLERENPNPHSSGKFDKLNQHSLMKKSTIANINNNNNIINNNNNNNSNNNTNSSSHRTEIEMFTHKLPDAGMTRDSLFTGHSLTKLDDRGSCGEERNEYQLLGQSHEYRNLNLPQKYFNNYMVPHSESPTNHPLLIPGESVNTFLTMKPTVSTSFV